MSVLFGAAFAVLIAGGNRYADLVVGDREALLARHAWRQAVDQAARQAAQDIAQRASTDAPEQQPASVAGADRTDSEPADAGTNAADAEAPSAGDTTSPEPDERPASDRPGREGVADAGTDEAGGAAASGADGTANVVAAPAEAPGRAPDPRLPERAPEPGGWIERNLGTPKGVVPNPVAGVDASGSSCNLENGDVDGDREDDGAATSIVTPDGPVDVGPAGATATPDLDDARPGPDSSSRSDQDQGQQERSGWQDDIVAAIDAVLAELSEDGDRGPSDAGDGAAADTVPDPLEQARQALAGLQAASAQGQLDYSEERSADLTRWHADADVTMDGADRDDVTGDGGTADTAGWDR